MKNAFKKSPHNIKKEKCIGNYYIVKVYVTLTVYNTKLQLFSYINKIKSKKICWHLFCSALILRIWFNKFELMLTHKLLCTINCLNNINTWIQ